jgi:flavin reductase (DIM6/NTAB) family NADH-FMN oxidoreductase RutF
MTADMDRLAATLQAAEADDPGFQPTPATTRAFRDALGSFATGVTVITTPGDDGQPVGITANSFASLSLDPPLVLWSPARSSRRFDLFAGADHYAIHVLGAAQGELAQHFTRNPHPPEAGLGPVLARFDCTRHAVHEGGDHAIVVGRVLRVWHRPGAPLVFHGGQFRGFSAH